MLNAPKRKLSQEVRVILLRHGESTYNAQGLYQGSSNASLLTEAGRSSARQTGAFLRGLTIDAIYTSPLQRAQATAHELLSVMDPEADLQTIQVADQLRETDMPAWQGLSFQYIRRQFPADYRTWKQRPHEFQMALPQPKQLWEEGGGGVALPTQQWCFPALDLYQRVRQFWQATLPHHAGRTLLLSTHGGTNRALIVTALSLAPDRFHTIQQSNCGISVLRFPDADCLSAQLDVMNLATHVGEPLPKPKEGGRGLRLLLIPSGAIPPAQTQQLATLLKPVTLHFGLNSNLDSSQLLAQQILHHHPATVQLQVLPEAFPHAWLQTIDARRSGTVSAAANDQLVTGLVVASAAIIESLLGQTLGLDSDQLWRLPVQPGRLSLVHYPSAEHPPILQAMNICEQSLGATR